MATCKLHFSWVFFNSDSYPLVCFDFLYINKKELQAYPVFFKY